MDNVLVPISESGAFDPLHSGQKKTGMVAQKGLWFSALLVEFGLVENNPATNR
jgi:hypothetical protein